MKNYSIWLRAGEDMYKTKCKLYIIPNTTNFRYIKQNILK